MKIRPVVVWFRRPVSTGERQWQEKLDFQADAEATPDLGSDVLLKFVTVSGETLFVPREAIAWIELGAEMEQPA